MLLIFWRILSIYLYVILLPCCLLITLSGMIIARLSSEVSERSGPERRAVAVPHYNSINLKPSMNSGFDGLVGYLGTKNYAAKLPC